MYLFERQLNVKSGIHDLPLKACIVYVQQVSLKPSFKTISDSMFVRGLRFCQRAFMPFMLNLPRWFQNNTAASAL